MIDVRSGRLLPPRRHPLGHLHHRRAVAVDDLQPVIPHRLRLLVLPLLLPLVPLLRRVDQPLLGRRQVLLRLLPRAEQLPIDPTRLDLRNHRLEHGCVSPLLPSLWLDSPCSVRFGQLHAASASSAAPSVAFFTGSTTSDHSYASPSRRPVTSPRSSPLVNAAIALSTTSVGIEGT